MPSFIDLKKVKERYPSKIDRLTDPIHLKIEENQNVCITSFGVIVFWPFDPKVAEDVLSDLSPIIVNPQVVKEVEDRLVVATDMEESKVLFNEIWLKGEPTFDEINLITLLLAQSVALDFIEIQVDETLERIEKYAATLRDKGRLAMSNKTVFRNIGFALDIRHRVLGSLALLDKPDATWDSEPLERLYTQLYRNFDLTHRHQTVMRKLEFISDNTHFLYEALSTKRGLQLEWAIVILIVIEIFIFGISELFLH